MPVVVLAVVLVVLAATWVVPVAVLVIRVPAVVLVVVLAVVLVARVLVGSCRRLRIVTASPDSATVATVVVGSCRRLRMVRASQDSVTATVATVAVSPALATVAVTWVVPVVPVAWALAASTRVLAAVPWVPAVTTGILPRPCSKVPKTSSPTTCKLAGQEEEANKNALLTPEIDWKIWVAVLAVLAVLVTGISMTTASTPTWWASSLLLMTRSRGSNFQSTQRWVERRKGTDRFSVSRRLIRTVA